MTQQHQLNAQQVHSTTPGIRMLQGAGAAFVLMAIFLLGVNDPNPEWGKYWMTRPLFVTTVAGAIGGVFYYFMAPLRSQEGFKKVTGIILSLLGYLIIIWLGAVYGMDGTLWD